MKDEWEIGITPIVDPKLYSNDAAMETIEKDYRMRCDFEMYLREFGEKYDFPSLALNQLMRLLSNWVMFNHNPEDWKEQIDKIQNTLNCLR